MIAIIDLVSLGEPIPAGGLGALIERFRDTPHGDTLARLGTEQDESEFEESVVETLFEDTLRKLQGDAIAREITELLELSKQGALSAGDRHRLSELLLEKRNLASTGKVSDL